MVLAPIESLYYGVWKLIVSKRLVNHPAKDINISNMKKKIKFTWEERSSFDTERVGAMYCFKRCDVNQN